MSGKFPSLIGGLLAPNNTQSADDNKSQHQPHHLQNEADLMFAAVYASPSPYSVDAGIDWNPTRTVFGSSSEGGSRLNNNNNNNNNNKNNIIIKNNTHHHTIDDSNNRHHAKVK